MNNKIQDSQTLENIRKINPDYSIQSIINNSEFLKYGQIYSQFVINDILNYLNKQQISPNSNQYNPSEQQLEEINEIKTISNYIFPGIKTESGSCNGHCTNFTAVEYHQGSEVNIFATDVIMVLGKRYQIKNEYFDTDRDAKLFFIPAGSIVEFYSDTLHYTPIMVHHSGFQIVVMVIKGTNQEFAIPYNGGNQRVVKVNKFQLVHPIRKDKIQKGQKVGLKGKLIEINPLKR